MRIIAFLINICPVLFFCTTSHIAIASSTSRPSLADAFFADDSLGIVITQNTTYLMPGQMFELTVFTRCNTRHQIHQVTINRTSIELDDKGVTTYAFPVAAVGHYTIPVTVSYTGKDGRLQQKTYPVEFTVGQANASVALDKMNVLYIGVDNPITVAASGGGDDKISLVIEGGGGLVSKLGNGRYNVRVKTVTDECIIHVYMDEKVAGSSLFRVRSLPVPVGTVGGFTSGDSVSAGAFSAQQGVGAYLRDFPIDVRFEIIGYTLNVYDDKGEVKAANCTGAYFSSEAKEMIKQYLKPGRTVTIGNLFVKGPDGKTVKLSPLIYHIK